MKNQTISVAPAKAQEIPAAAGNTKLHVMLPPRIGALARRMQSDCGAETLTDAVGNAVEAYAALLALLRGGRTALCLRSLDGGPLQELRITSLTREAVTLHPLGGSAAPELPPDLFEVSAAYEPPMRNTGAINPPMAVPDKRAVLTQLQGAMNAIAPPAKPLILPHQRPGKTMMSVEEVATAMTMSEARVLAALKNGEYEGAELVDGEWWIPQSEVKVRR
jgi:hypothetical protein